MRYRLPSKLVIRIAGNLRGFGKNGGGLLAKSIGKIFYWPYALF